MQKDSYVLKVSATCSVCARYYMRTVTWGFQFGKSEYDPHRVPCPDCEYEIQVLIRDSQHLPYPAHHLNRLP